MRELRDLTVGQLLELFPAGFSVGSGGTLSKIVMASSHLSKITQATMGMPPPNGGFLVVDMVPAGELAGHDIVNQGQPTY